MSILSLSSVTMERGMADFGRKKMKKEEEEEEEEEKKR